MKEIGSWFTDFWALVTEVWHRSFWGVELGPLVLALVVLLIALTARHAFSVTAVAIAKRLAARTQTRFDDAVVDAVQGPLRFVPVVFGLFVAVQILEFDPGTELIALRIIQSLIAVTIFWALYNVVTPLATLFHRLDHVLGAALVEWMMTAVRVLVVFVGAAAVLQSWGIQVVPLLAGFGLLGVAVALGAQDMFKNLIAGLTLLVERRFNKGDWVRVDGVVEGIVERIGLRSTIIRRFDKAPVHVPNAHLADNPMTNFTAMSHRRIYWKIGVEYRTTKEQLMEICRRIEDYIVGSPEFAKPSEVPTFVRVDAFNASSIDIMVYCFTIDTKWGEWLRIKEGLAYRIKQIVEEAGTAFAFPSQSVYVESLPEAIGAERFTPPEGGERARWVAGEPAAR